MRKLFTIEIGVDFGDQHTDELEAELVSDMKDGLEDPVKRLRLAFTDPSVESGPLDEPPFDENHYRYHTPAGPNPECANCAYLNWRQP